MQRSSLSTRPLRSGLQTFRILFLRVFEIWAEALPNSRASFVIVSTSETFWFPDLIPSNMQVRGRTASNRKPCVFTRSLSISFASQSLLNFDSMEVKRSSSLGVLVVIVLGTGYRSQIFLVLQSFIQGALQQRFRLLCQLQFFCGPRRRWIMVLPISRVLDG